MMCKTPTRLLLVLGVLAFSRDAKAEEIAVLDFDGYGVSFDDASLVSQGFRDAFLEEGSFFPLEAFDITERLAQGFEADIAQARQLVGSARTSIGAGNYSRGLSLLDQARQLHESAGSALANRPEMADVYFFQGQAYMKLGQRSRAVTSFEKCLWLYPGYGETRARSGNSSQVMSALEEAAGRQTSADRRKLGPEMAARLAARLDVGAVVSGYLDETGVIYARMTRGSRLVGELRRRSEEIPPFPGDPIYLQMVKELVAGVGSVSSTASPSLARNRFDGEAGSADDFTDLPAFEETGERVEEDPGPSSRTPARKPQSKKPFVWPWQKGRNYGSGDSEFRIRQEGKVSKPITEQWWFWTAAGTAVVGTGATAAYLLATKRSSDPSGSGAGTYTVTVVETSN